MDISVQYPNVHNSKSWKHVNGDLIRIQTKTKLKPKQDQNKTKSNPNLRPFSDVIWLILDLDTQSQIGWIFKSKPN